MIIVALVSRYERAGKSEAARRITARRPGTWRRFSLVNRVNMAVGMFVGNSSDKYGVHPVLGVSMKDVNHIISDALTKKHPELPVYRTKQEIEETVKDHLNVVIDDMRRQREFVWAEQLARKYGGTFHIIEVIPVGDAMERTRVDRWSNGIEPCGYEAWKDLSRAAVFNDGTEKYFEDVLDLVSKLREQESV